MNRAGIRLCQPCSCPWWGAGLDWVNGGFFLRTHGRLYISILHLKEASNTVNPSNPQSKFCRRRRSNISSTRLQSVKIKFGSFSRSSASPQGTLICAFLPSHIMDYQNQPRPLAMRLKSFGANMILSNLGRSAPRRWNHAHHARPAQPLQFSDHPTARRPQTRHGDANAPVSRFPACCRHLCD